MQVKVRRSFLVAAVVLGACGGPSPRGPSSAPPALIPRAVLFGNPERGNLAISPDGTHVAFSAPSAGVMNVFVAPVGELEHATQVTFDPQRPVRTFQWTGDGRYLLYLQDKGGNENFHLYRVGVDGKDAADLTPFDDVRAQILAVSDKRPGQILVGVNNRKPELHDVYEVDLATAKATLKVENPGYAGWVTDDDLNVRFALSMDSDGNQHWFRPAPGGTWTEFDQIGQSDSMTSGLVGFESSGARYYLFDSRGRDTGALFSVDVASGKRTLVAEDPTADAGELLTHPTTGVVRAVRFEHARKEWKVLDPAIAGDLAAIAEVDDGDASVVSMTRDDRRWIVLFNSDHGSPRFYLWDRDAQKATFLYAVRPALEGLPLPRMYPATIRARDGLDLVSYLSLPVEVDVKHDGTATAPMPMVLLVHGGPWSRVSWGYSGLAALLANRGYAVLQVNFRGSTGFGKKFVNAGDRQWGKAMHDDLLDGVDWAVAHGLTRKDTVCILGGSYGGYATLAALTLTPTVFTCGVDIVGPSNLKTLLASVPPYWKPILSMFKTRVGDPDTAEGSAILDAASPLTHVAAIARPLLIGQGANDPRVKRAESDQIVKAMQDKGLPVTYVLFPDEGHGFARPENNLAFMAVAEAFLSVHLGGRAQPMTAADFAGSTMQVLAGRDGIPGLPDGVGVVPAP